MDGLLDENASIIALVGPRRLCSNRSVTNRVRAEYEGQGVTDVTKNGNGCDEGCVALERLAGEVKAMSVNLEIALEGVSNFKQFQKNNIEFMGWFRATQEEKARLDSARAKLHYWWLGILSAIIVASVLGAGAWIINFMTTHHITESNTPVSSSYQPTDARNPNTR